MKPVRLEKVNGQFFMSQEDVEELRRGLRIMSVTHSNQLAKIRKAWTSAKQYEISMVSDMIEMFFPDTHKEKALRMLRTIQRDLNKALEVNNDIPHNWNEEKTQ